MNEEMTTQKQDKIIEETMRFYNSLDDIEMDGDYMRKVIIFAIQKAKLQEQEKFEKLIDNLECQVCKNPAEIVLISPSGKSKIGYCKEHYHKHDFEQQGLFRNWKIKKQIIELKSKLKQGGK